MPKLKVVLSHRVNPDIPEGYRSPELLEGIPAKMIVQVSNLQEASEICQEYLEKFDLGAGNWSGGTVMDNEGEKVAHVSYNGNVWDAFGPHGLLYQPEDTSTEMRP